MALQAALIPLVTRRFAALADENRLRLLLVLRHGEKNVTALTADLGISQASVSKHLAVLRQVGLVERTSVGAQALYRVRDRSIYNLCQLVCNGVLDHVRREHAALGLSVDASTDEPKATKDRGPAARVGGRRRTTGAP